MYNIFVIFYAVLQKVTLGDVGRQSTFSRKRYYGNQILYFYYHGRKSVMKIVLTKTKMLYPAHKYIYVEIYLRISSRYSN